MTTWAYFVLGCKWLLIFGFALNVLAQLSEIQDKLDKILKGKK